MKNILLLLFILLVISYILTYIIRLLALRHKILDIPNERSSHTIPTPRGGGLAIVVVWYIGISILLYYNSIDRSLYLALMSGVLLAGISIIDDLFNIRPYIRFVIQVITAVFAILLLGGVNSISIQGFEINSGLILNTIIIVGIVWFINLYNFLDGIDGYASMEAIFILVVMYLLTGSIICLVLVFSVLGFLYWNWPKAKIFMGDIGSTQLGFILIILGIYFHNKSELKIIHWIMLSSLFWFDATLTLYRRWRKNEKLTVAHRKHAYQRIVQAGFSHQKTLLCSLAINIPILALVILSKKYDLLIIPLFFLNVLFLYWITKLIDNKVPFKEG